MKISLMATAAIAISVLSACGGDLVNKLDELADDFNDDAKRIVNEQKFDDFIANAKALDQAQFPPSELLSGKALMGGYLALVDTDLNELNQVIAKRFTVGDASINVDFSQLSDGGFDGTVKDFVKYEGSPGCLDDSAPCTGDYSEELGGELTITGRSPLQFGRLIVYNLSGNLTGTDSSGAYSAEIDSKQFLGVNLGQVDGLLVAKSVEEGFVDVRISAQGEQAVTVQSEVMLHIQDLD